MAANCEKLKLTVTGYNCLDLMQARILHDSIEQEYHTVKRIEDAKDL